MNHKITIGLLTIILTVSLFSCKNNPSGPTDNAQPGRRDYTWTVDTLFLPFNPFTAITGTSPNDVWACGPGGDLDKTLYHYDGQSWKTDSISRPFSPLSIYCETGDLVWSSGLDGQIWTYDGLQWQEKYRMDFAGDTVVDFITISALSNNNIIAAGHYFNVTDFYGVIIKYDGAVWSKINIPLIRTAFANIQESNNGKIYLWGVTNEQFTESRNQIYELNGDNLEEIYSGSQTHSEKGNLLQLGDKTYFIIGYDFFSYNDFDFKKIGRLSDNPKFLNVGWGRNEKDIFIGMRDGIAHYNGENTVYLYQSSENIFVRKGIVFDNEVFFIGSDGYGNNLMIHGKLN